jgi:GT2 family glycosyltransferase
MTSVDDPPVVVVLPTYNGASFVGEQLDALMQQETQTAWHLVVVDGGSSDGTIDIVHGWKHASVPMRIVRLHGGPGVNAGINAGVACTTSPLILVAEHDDVVAPGWIQSLADALHDTELVGSRLERSSLNRRQDVVARNLLPEDVKILPYPDSTGMGFRRTLWQNLGGFDESYRYGGNDAEFCFRAVQRGYGLSIALGAKVHYRVRTSFSNSFRQGRGYALSMVRLHSEFGAEFVRPRTASQFGREVGRLLALAARSPFQPTVRMRLAYRSGLQTGWLIGSWRYRCVFL